MIEKKVLGAWDYVIFVGVLLISVLIGIWFGCTGGKQRTITEFLLADRQMGVLPVALSTMATFQSAVTLLGIPAEMYVYGTGYWTMWIAFLIMIPITAYVFLPIFFRLKITSVYEYLEMRFSAGVRLCVTISFLIQMIFLMAVNLYGPSLALSAVTTLNLWYSVLCVGIVTIFYTTLGGMKAVMWTDVFQIIIMFSGIIVILVKGSEYEGGIVSVWQHMVQSGRVQFFDFTPNPLMRQNFWAVAIGGTFFWLSLYGVNQAQVQRQLSVANLRTAQIALWINLFGLSAILTICGLLGSVLYAAYRDCDPLTSKPQPRITAIDQLLPLYVMDKMSHIPGLAGLFTACLFSGCLSTLSSGLNALAAVFIEDIVKVWCFRNLSETRAAVATKIIAICLGVLCLILTYVASNLGGILQAAIVVIGMIGGAQLGVFTLGILYPCATWQGAYAGFFSGLILTLWVGLGAFIHKPPVSRMPVSNECPANAFLNETLPSLFNETTTSWMTTEFVNNTVETARKIKPGYTEFYKLSYLWYTAFGVLVCSVVGLAVSFFSGMNRSKSVDRKLIFPIFDIFCQYLPKCLHQPFNKEVYEDEYKGTSSSGDVNPNFHTDDNIVINYVNTETLDTRL